MNVHFNSLFENVNDVCTDHKKARYCLQNTLRYYNRDVVLNLLFDSECSVDDVRLVKMLLSNTQLRVKLKSEESS